MGKRSFQDSNASHSTYKKARSAKMVRPSIKNAIERILSRRVERKEITTFQSSTAITTTGTILTINTPGEGSDTTQRIGRHITMYNVDVDYSIVETASFNDSGFVALVLDRQPDAGGLGGFSGIFDQSASQPAGVAFKNSISGDKRFKLLWVDQFAIGVGGPSIVKNRHFYKFNTESTDSVVEFNGTTASLPNTNALYVVWGSTVNSTNNTNIIVNTKLKFQDI